MLMKKLSLLLAVPAVCLLVSACGDRYQSDYYSGTAAQRASTVEYGKVVSARTVKIRNEENKYGSLVGAAAGGVGGSAIGGDWRMNALGALGGMVAGGVLGAAVDDQLNEVDGYEYIVETRSGRTMAVAQTDKTPFAAGDDVMLILGPPSRLIRM